MKRFPHRREGGHPQGDFQLIQAVTRHVERHVGPIDFVCHETESRLVHIDVHHVPPSKDRPFHTLVTSGMAERRMTVPPTAPESAYAELFLLLPPRWDLAASWPIQLLRELARFPHEWGTWLGYGHTIQNGTSSDPYGSGIRFCATLLTLPVCLGPDFATLTLRERSIHLYQIVPLYREELQFALRHGTDALLARFAQYQMSDVVDTERRNVCRFEVH